VAEKRLTAQALRRDGFSADRLQWLFRRSRLPGALLYGAPEFFDIGVSDSVMC
jgi:hypothetical protein